jgi:hypothetical protein
MQTIVDFINESRKAQQKLKVGDVVIYNDEDATVTVINGPEIEIKQGNKTYTVDIDLLKTENKFLNESKKITSDDEFTKFAIDRLKTMHGDKFDQAIADKMIADLLEKYKDNYGAMIGAMNYG